MAANLPTTDPNFVQMVILTADRKKKPLTRTEASEFEKYIFKQISATTGKRPRFKGQYVFSDDDGAVIINTHVDSVNWLKEVVRCYKRRALRIIDSPQYTAKVDVDQLDMEVVDNLLDLLEAHNVGLKTDGWRFMGTCMQLVYYNSAKKVKYAKFLIDNSGRKMLEENGFKLVLGFSTITFKLLGTVNRSETTGEICKDDV